MVIFKNKNKMITVQQAQARSAKKIAKIKAEYLKSEGFDFILENLSREIEKASDNGLNSAHVELGFNEYDRPRVDALTSFLEDMGYHTSISYNHKNKLSLRVSW